MFHNPNTTPFQPCHGYSPASRDPEKELEAGCLAVFSASRAAKLRIDMDRSPTKYHPHKMGNHMEQYDIILYDIDMYWYTVEYIIAWGIRKDL